MDLEYLLKNSQLHGINRLAERKYRIPWAIALVLVLVAAIMSLLITFWRYQSNPTFITRLESFSSDKGFPAVLVCPELEFPDFKKEKFLDEIELPPSLNRTYVRRVLRQLAAYYSPDVLYTVGDLHNLEHLLNHNNLGVEEVALRLTLTCEETLLRCRWRGEIVDCSQIFHMEVMQFGFCCVFNGRSLKRELRNDEFPIRRPVNKMYTNLIGYKSGLMLAINQNNVLKSIDLSYKWIIIAGGQRFVDSLSVNGSALSPGVEVWFGYQTYSFAISDETKLLSQELRRCRLSTEKLPNFPIYKKVNFLEKREELDGAAASAFGLQSCSLSNFRNAGSLDGCPNLKHLELLRASEGTLSLWSRNYCRQECEMANVMKMCNCTLHTHPAPWASHCGPSALPCAKTVSRQTSFESCNCMSTCDVVYDDVVTTVYKLSPKKELIDNFYDGLDINKMTVVRVFVQKMEESRSSRQSYFSSFDLFSQMGGIFNVFFGCSVLSLLELYQLVWYSFKQWRSTKTPNPKKHNQIKSDQQKQQKKNRVRLLLTHKEK